MNPENLLKGRMAEALVEDLLRQFGNVVYRFGYEAILQNLTQAGGKFDRFSDVGERIRAIQDFIVIDKRGRPVFVEVKFRWKPELHQGDYSILEKIERFWGAKLVFVNCWEQPYFRVSNPPYVDRNKRLIANPLLQEKDWNIARDLYDAYEDLVHRYLTPTLIPTKKR